MRALVRRATSLLRVAAAEASSPHAAPPPPTPSAAARILHFSVPMDIRLW
uniref:Uncharacterized protein n=1 Tax=Arundo donax TaxID=35708 RepID=A0A0A9GUA4_ARUDO